MPKCSLCGKSVPNKADLMLVRGNEGRWEAQCRACAQPAGGAAPAPVPAMAAPTRDAAASAGPSLTAEAIVEAFQRIRSTLASLDAKASGEAPLRTHQRAHERREIDLLIRFACERDDIFHEAVLRDISRGGMRFLTTRTLQSGQILRFESGTVAEDAAPVLALLQGAGEVRRVTPTEDGGFMVGVRFVKRMVANAANRRRHKRIPVDMAAYLRRTGSDFTEKGQVRDLSQGGVCLLVDGDIEKDEEMQLILRGEAGAFARADLYGRIRVMRVSRQRRGFQELGCAFLEVQMRPRPTATVQG